MPGKSVRNIHKSDSNYLEQMLLLLNPNELQKNIEKSRTVLHDFYTSEIGDILRDQVDTLKSEIRNEFSRNSGTSSGNRPYYSPQSSGKPSSPLSDSDNTFFEMGDKIGNDFKKGLAGDSSSGGSSLGGGSGGGKWAKLGAQIGANIANSVLNTVGDILKSWTTNTYGSLDITGSFNKGTSLFATMREELGNLSFGEKNLQAFSGMIQSSYKQLKEDGVIVSPTTIYGMYSRLGDIVSLTGSSNSRLTSMLNIATKMEKSSGQIDIGSDFVKNLTTSLGEKGLDLANYLSSAAEVLQSRYPNVDDTQIDATINSKMNERIYQLGLAKGLRDDALVQFVKKESLEFTQTGIAAANQLGASYKDFLTFTEQMAQPGIEEYAGSYGPLGKFSSYITEQISALGGSLADQEWVALNYETIMEVAAEGLQQVYRDFGEKGVAALNDFSGGVFNSTNYGMLVSSDPSSWKYGNPITQEEIDAQQQAITATTSLADRMANFDLELSGLTLSSETYQNEMLGTVIVIANTLLSMTGGSGLIGDIAGSAIGTIGGKIIASKLGIGVAGKEGIGAIIKGGTSATGGLSATAGGAIGVGAALVGVADGVGDFVEASNTVSEAESEKLNTTGATKVGIGAGGAILAGLAAGSAGGPIGAAIGAAAGAIAVFVVDPIADLIDGTTAYAQGMERMKKANENMSKTLEENAKVSQIATDNLKTLNRHDANYSENLMEQQGYLDEINSTLGTSFTQRDLEQDRINRTRSLIEALNKEREREAALEQEKTLTDNQDRFKKPTNDLAKDAENTYKDIKSANAFLNAYDSGLLNMSNINMSDQDKQSISTLTSQGLDVYNLVQSGLVAEYDADTWSRMLGVDAATGKEIASSIAEMQKYDISSDDIANYLYQSLYGITDSEGFLSDQIIKYQDLLQERESTAESRKNDILSSLNDGVDGFLSIINTGGGTGAFKVDTKHSDKDYNTLDELYSDYKNSSKNKNLLSEMHKLVFANDGYRGLLWIQDYMNNGVFGESEKSVSELTGISVELLEALRDYSGVPEDSIHFAATGLDNIPYDGFPAILHEGEMVIPAKRANWLRVAMGQKPVNYSNVPANKDTGNNSFVQSIPEYASGIDAVNWAKSKSDWVYNGDKRSEDGYFDCSSLVTRSWRAVDPKSIGGIYITSGIYNNLPKQGWTAMYDVAKVGQYGDMRSLLPQLGAQAGDIALTYNHKGGGHSIGNGYRVNHAMLVEDGDSMWHITTPGKTAFSQNFYTGNRLVGLYRYGAATPYSGDGITGSQTSDSSMNTDNIPENIRRLMNMNSAYAKAKLRELGYSTDGTDINTNNNVTPGSLASLAAQRATFNEELQSTEVLYKALNRAVREYNYGYKEGGTNIGTGYKMWLESAINRAYARGITLLKAVDGAYYGSGKGTASSERPKNYDVLKAAFDEVMAGSNLSNYSTGNGTANKNIYVRMYYNGEPFVLEKNSKDLAWAKSMGVPEPYGLYDAYNGYKKLAEGGIVRATPGGIPTIIGEGKSDEAVIPLKENNDYLGIEEMSINIIDALDLFCERVCNRLDQIISLKKEENKSPEIQLQTAQRSARTMALKNLQGIY